MLKENKITDHRLHEKDTGSTAVQIIVLNNRIEKQKAHLHKNHKDIPLKRSLLKNIAYIRRLLTYLKKKDNNTFEKLNSGYLKNR